MELEIKPLLKKEHMSRYKVSGKQDEIVSRINELVKSFNLGEDRFQLLVSRITPIFEGMNDLEGRVKKLEDESISGDISKDSSSGKATTASE